MKLRLNKLSKENTDAEYIRRLLEVEDVNIRAKGTRPYYRKRVYRIKDRMLRELVDFCEKHNYTYGAQETDDFSTKEILYFELPDGIQVSFTVTIYLQRNMKRNGINSRMQLFPK